MTQRDNEDLAKALEGMAGSDDGAPSSGAAAQPPNSKPVKARPTAPVPMQGAPKPVAPRPVVPPGATPLPPGAIKSQQKKEETTSKAKSPPGPRKPAVARPQAPMRPQIPGLPQSDPATQSIVAPSSDWLSSPELPSSGMAEIVTTDDDAVMVPAPAMETLGQVHAKLDAAHHRPHLPTIKSVEARRTVIPVLLTCGLLLFIAATMRLVTSPDTPLRSLPPWMSWAGYALGVLLWGVALINMFSVRKELQRAG